MKCSEKRATHLTEEERKEIATLYWEGYSPYKIGKILGRASNTVRNELKRGTITVIINGFEKEQYFPDTGQAVYEKNRRRCRKPKKIDTCKDFIMYVEEQVLCDKRSFASVRAEALDKNLFSEEETCSVVTLYTYAERRLLKVKNIDLPEKVSRKPKRKKKGRKHKRLNGVCIEERPESVNDREEFGHWEIDLVIGKQSAKDNVLLTLTERLTRKEIIRKISGKTSKAVHRCLNRLKKEIPHFKKIFQSITTDNGSEFAQLHEWGKKQGVDIYYAHPYSSWERGLNENTNRIIRRWVPKGKMIKNYSKKQIQKIEEWINTMYRKSLGWKTAEYKFQEVVEQLLQVS